MKKILLATALTSTLLLAFDAGDKIDNIPGLNGIGGIFNFNYIDYEKVEKDGGDIYLRLDNGQFYEDKELTKEYEPNTENNETTQEIEKNTKENTKKTLDDKFVNKFNAQFSEKSTFATTTLLKANVSRLHIPVFIKTTLNDDSDNNITNSDRTRHVLLDPNSGHLNVRFDIFDWVIRKYNFDKRKLDKFDSNDYDAYGVSFQVGTKIEKFSDDYKEIFSPKSDFYYIPYINLLAQADLSSYYFRENKPERYGSLIVGAMASVQLLPENEIENLLPEEDLGSELYTGSLFFSIDLAKNVALKLTHSFEIGNPSFNKTQLGIEVRQ